MWPLGVPVYAFLCIRNGVGLQGLGMIGPIGRRKAECFMKVDMVSLY